MDPLEKLLNLPDAELLEALYQSNPWMRPRRPKYQVWDVKEKRWIKITGKIPIGVLIIRQEMDSTCLVQF